MVCPYGTQHPPCDYEIECEVQSEALEEAYEQYKELTAEIAFLTKRIEQLEKFICESGIQLPIDLLLR